MAQVGTLQPGTAFACMQRFSLPLIVAAAFTVGVIAGYALGHSFPQGVEQGPARRCDFK